MPQSNPGYNLDASPVALGDLLSQSFFSIPRYQRSYSWKKAQHDDLWEDLTSTIDHDQHHYIGTIVLQRKESKIESTGGRTHNSFLVVDGQQRLTTLSLYAMALYKHLSDKRRASTLWEDFVRHPHLELDSGERARIMPGTTNQEYFEVLLNKIESNGIAPEPKGSSNRLLKEAFDYYDQKFEAAADRRGDQWLIEISKSLRNKIQVLPFITEDRAFAIKMFQTVNDRGKPIGLLDKTKGFLMFYAVKYLPQEDRLIEFADQTFGNVFSRFDKSKEIGKEYDIRYISNPSFQFSESEILKFAYHYVFKKVKKDFELKANYDFSIRASDVLKFIKSSCNELQDSPESLEDFIIAIVGALEKVSSGLVNILKFVAEEPDRSSISDLLRWQDASAAVYPLLINGYLEDVLDEELIDLVRVLDMRVYKIRGTEPKAGLYQNSISEFCLNGKTGSIRQEIRNFIDHWGSNKEIRKNVESDMYQKKYSNILLWKWSKRNSKSKERSDYDTFSRLEREHIFPKENSKVVSTGYGFSGEEDYVNHRDTLGNLCLLEKKINSKAGNNLPVRKAEFYQRSNLRETSLLGAKIEESGFAKKDVQERTQKIADFVLSHWAIPEYPSN